MEKLITDTTALMFDLKGEIAEGHYLQLMNNLKEMTNSSLEVKDNVE